MGACVNLPWVGLSWGNLPRVIVSCAQLPA